MGLYVYNGSSWSSQATGFKLYNGSSWTNVNRGYVYNGSSWSQFYPEAPANTAAPTITYSSGSAYPAGVNQSLSASTGTWTNSPTSYSYQWEYKPLNGSFSSIAGATSSSYSIPASMSGAAIRIAVTATNARGSTTAYSSDTGYLSPAPLTGATASKTGYGTVFVSWNASYGATLYYVQYSPNFTETSTTSTSITISGLPGPTVGFYISANTKNNGQGALPWGLPGQGANASVLNLP